MFYTFLLSDLFQCFCDFYFLYFIHFCKIQQVTVSFYNNKMKKIFLFRLFFSVDMLLLEKINQHTPEREISPMAIQIVRGNKAELLADSLIDAVRNDMKHSSLFEPLEIIVPNKGIARFLKLRFAEKSGAVAGVEFPYLMSWLTRRVLNLPGSIGDHGSDAADAADYLPDLRGETIAWRIWQKLPGLLGYPEFQSLHRFLSDGDPRRLWSLARILGEQFDRMILLRPDWICAWENGDEPDDIACQPEDIRAEARMQGILWQTIAGDDWKGKHFAARIMKEGKGLPKLNGTVRIFGFSAIPESVLALLERLSGENEIVLYNFDPCENYWGDAVSRKAELTELERLWFSGDGNDENFEELAALFHQNNRLLGSFARAGRELYLRTAEYEDAGAVFSDPSGAGILSEAQNLVLLNSPAGNDGTPICCDAAPGHIQIHSCYSAFREVEALHEYLQSRFAEDPALRQKDVFILTPDPESFAPLIDAVFHNPGIPEENQLEISMTDLKNLYQQTELRTLFKIMALHNTEFTANDVFSILRQDTIMKHAGLEIEQLERCAEMIRSSGIRWGWNKAERMESYPYSETSWCAGLNRLFAGFALDETVHLLPETPEGDILPVSCLGDPETLGILANLVEKLHDAAAMFAKRDRGGVTLDEWRRDLLALADDFFGSDAALLPLLRQVLSNLGNELRTLQEPVQIPGAILPALLEAHVNATAENKGFMTGKITFAGLRPMRSIPAKIICLIGMGHDKFPSKPPKYGFDLIRRVPRRGDHDSSMDDRQLFLELFLAAREHFYISYTGRGIRDNKPRPPSACVDEFIRYLESTFGEKGCLKVQHPLQAFSPEYFLPGTPIPGHSEDLCLAARFLRDNAVSEIALMGNMTPFSEPLPDSLCTVTPENLCWFFRNPAQQFCKERLQAVSLQKTGAKLEDSEELAVPGMDRDHLQCVYQILEGNDGDCDVSRAEIIRKFQADGCYPLAPYAKEDEGFKETINVIEMIRQEVKALQNDAVVFPAKELVFKVPDPENTEIILHLPEMTLYRQPDGSLLNLMILFNEFYPGDNLRIRLQTLAAHTLADTDVTTKLFTVTGTRVSCSVGRDVSTTWQELLEIYAEGMCHPVPFFPKSSKEYYDVYTKNDPKKKKDPVLEASKKWYSTTYAANEDQIFAPYFGKEFPFGDSFVKCAMRVYSFASVVEEKKEKEKKKK